MHTPPCFSPTQPQPTHLPPALRPVLALRREFRGQGLHFRLELSLRPLGPRLQLRQRPLELLCLSDGGRRLLLRGRAG